MAAKNYRPVFAVLALALGPLAGLGGLAARLGSGRVLEALAYPAGALAGLSVALPRLAASLTGGGDMKRAGFTPSFVVFPPVGKNA